MNTKSRRGDTGAQKSARPIKRKQGGKGKPFTKGNPYRIQAGTILNPGGRPRRLSEAYADWLRSTDENGIPNANKVAFVVGAEALKANDKAYKEMRQATEGDKVLNYNLDAATDEQLERIANGEHPNTVLADPGPSTATPATTQGAASDGAHPAALPVDSV